MAVNLDKHYRTGSREKRAVKAKNSVRAKISRALHIPLDQVKLSTSVNELIWSRGRERPPHKVHVAVHQENEKVTVYLESEREQVLKALTESASKKTKTKKESKKSETEKESSKELPAAHEAPKTETELAEKQEQKKELEKQARSIELTRA